MSLEETIIARSTPLGAACRGIVRLSGPASLQALATLFEPAIRGDCSPWIQEGVLFPWGKNRPIPAKIFYWPPGRGYTAQESLEVHTIGSPPILEAILEAFVRTGAVRPARPGEFTMRAFLAGRLDLTRAEAVLGVIDASSEEALAAALAQLAGGIASPLGRIYDALFDLLVRLEAGLDFVEEEIEFVTPGEIRSVLEESFLHTERLRARMEERECVNEKWKIVLAGPPNAGKSTLFNRLIGMDRSIVSPVPGTTRDYIETEISIDGIPCLLVDTAGRDDRIAPEGIDGKANCFSKDLCGQADLVIYCTEYGFPVSRFPRPGIAPERILHVRTKWDKAPAEENEAMDSVAVSSKDDKGVDLLCERLAERLRAASHECDVVPGTASRCRHSLFEASRFLRRALDTLDTETSCADESLLAVDLRAALNALGLVGGAVHTEDLLDRIFERFCIGK